ncbi:putative naringenin-chalcone synthase [Rivularia sp. PCC 7116]|uniref:type III polyketide synthase n=1 Tax=Rivularia sp. PCC 7116 TaxID=373994 RepID=UPI00029EDB43|nr:3-oxoacyl-[acyl-carrier-protein] synthase III C-terminal domain-containing protein [Rivularia sp. PCC 7116]AFY56411.1 putative naringenin-chalcone synthase [Rivularia sp. PCC 7116]
MTNTTIRVKQQKGLIARLSNHNISNISSKQVLPTIEGIATGTPDNIISQKDAAEFVANLKNLDRNRHRIAKIYQNTRIEERRLAVNLLSEESYEFSRKQGTIQQRMEMFEEYAFPLAEKVAKQALKSAEASTRDDGSLYSDNIEESIGLIVFVTSTGFVAPGIDTKLIKSLGLKRNIARIPVHFMGCAAAMNGLRIACDYIKANPNQRALVVCLELSSVNAVFEDNINDTIIHSIFGDGCAAVVLGGREENMLFGRNKIVIKDNFSYLVDDTEDGIRLGINDSGITCKLSRDLPSYIENGLNPIINNFLADCQLTKEQIDLWAVHPGGTRIIEKAQSSLGLTDEQVADSWEILRQYGNMLSCAILFVIERVMLRLESESFQDGKTIPEKLTGLSFSFAPGIGVEGILFEKY